MSLNVCLFVGEFLDIVCVRTCFCICLNLFVCVFVFVYVYMRIWV